MRHFWQWFCGYVCIILNGNQINRFLNLCSRNGIYLWKIKRDVEHVIEANIKLSDFYYLKPYLKKTKTRIHIQSKKGFPFWCYRHPRLKWTFLIAFFITCLFIYSFNFLWTIEISGNEKISTYELLHFLESKQIERGIRKEGIDCSTLEYEMRQHFEELGWVSVYLERTKLCIEIKESLYDKSNITAIDDVSCRHLISEYDAEIYSIVTRRGTPVVTSGQHVRAGDILVLGECEIYDDAGIVKDIICFEADALIYADIERTIYIPMSEIELLTLNIAGNYTEEMLYSIANKKINTFLSKFEENGVIILDKNVMIDKKEKNIVFIAQIKTRERIGKTIPAEELLEYEFE